MAVFKFSNVGGFGTYQRYNDFLAGNPAVIQDKGSMYPLGIVTVPSGGTSFVEFANIPQTYTHLQIRGICRTARNSVGANIQMRLNGDTGSVYAWHGLYGTGASALSTNGVSQTSLPLLQWGAWGNTATSASFGVSVTDILDYKSTNKTKTLRSLNGREGNDTNGIVALTSGLWNPATQAAVTTIRIFEAGNENISEFSSFALYGVQA